MKLAFIQLLGILFLSLFLIPFIGVGGLFTSIVIGIVVILLQLIMPSN